MEWLFIFFSYSYSYFTSYFEEALFGNQALQSRPVSRRISSQTKKIAKKIRLAVSQPKKNYGLAAEKKSS